MKMIGYDIANEEALCFNRGRKTPLQLYASKGKSLDYNNKTKYDLGYVYSKHEINKIHESSSENTNIRSSSSLDADCEFDLNELFKHYGKYGIYLHWCS